MGSAQKERLGIKRIDSLHFFVRDLERSRDHYVQKLDFAEIAVSGPAFEQAEGARATLLRAGGVRFAFVSPLREGSESARWLAVHPEGIGRVVLEVEDIDHAYDLLTRRGATVITDLVRHTADGETMRWFDIATAFGDTMFRFVERTGTRGMMPHLVMLPAPRGGDNRFGIAELDHLTSNFLTLKPATMWMEQVLGLERYWGIEFHTQDVSKDHGEGSGLKSIVMWDPESGIKFANNEPAAPAFHASQIYKFCVDHRGPGVQHAALTVADIVGTVRAMRALDVGFMPTPGAYYDLLPTRLTELGIDEIDEDVATLRELQVLVDGDGPRQYLLQIFLREAAGLFGDPEAGPFFVELIQRKGDRGFGAGNFRALFESIERQQSRSCAA